MPVIGQPFTLTCSTNDSVSNLEWLTPTGEAQNEDRLIVGDIMVQGGITTRTLMFTSLEVSDSGEYTCQSEFASASSTLQIEGMQKECS